MAKRLSFEVRNAPSGSPTETNAALSPQERFPDYQPKRNPDTSLDFRPQLAPRLAGLPAATVQALPDLLRELGRYRTLARGRPGKWEQGNVILGADPKQYNPSDEELLENEIGRRIEEVISSAKAEELRQALQGAKIEDRQPSYGAVDFRHVDVMGSGRFFYASEPKEKAISLR